MRIPACAIVFIALASAAWSVPVSDELLAELETSGELTNFYDTTVQVSLAPSHSLTTRLVAELSDLAPDVGIEALFRYEIPEAMRSDPELDRYVYNVMRSFRTMEGIPYYSASRGKMRTFFYESYVVADAESLTPIPDPLVDTVPDADALTVFQRDSSFGRNTLHVEYRAGAGQVMVEMSNLTTMAYRGILPVVQPQSLRMYLYVVRDAGYLYFYGHCGVRTFSMFGMEDRAQASFTNRIRSLYDWFAAQMSEYQ